MSAVQDTTNPTTEATTEPTTTSATHVPETATEQPAVTDDATPKTDALASTEHQPETTAASTEAKDATVAPTEGKTDEALTATPAAAEKTTEPISEGQLGYKGPGLLKSLVPSKKEFWLSDSPVTPQHMDMYMRGEKPEVSHAVVAWASQTGRGLLFFNKKGDTGRTHPASVLPLYDAVDLKKSHPHDITFSIDGHSHTLKASSPAERDGWYASLERAMEMGKADKESVRSGEGYKAEMEKLNKPNMMAGGAAGAAGVAGATAAARSRSRPNKSVDADKVAETKRTGSDDDDLAKKDKKSRSTSRGGMLGRLKGKKDEMEAKREEKKEDKDEKKIEKEEVKEEKKEEKKEAKEEKKEEKELAKEEKKEEKHGGAAPAAAGAGAIAGLGALDAHGTADRALGAPVEANQAAETEPTKANEMPKSKRTSIFGRMQSGLSSMKSPSKEKSEKEAELKPEVPPKDTVVSETAPQIPEPSASEPAAEGAAVPAIETSKPETEGKPAEAAKEQLDTVSPKEKSSGGFLSNFLGKRNRSVSPSAAMKEAPVAPPKDEAAATTTEPVAAAAATTAEEPAKPTATTETPAVADTTSSPVETAEDPARTDATSPAGGKRQSVIGNLGRRASKAFKGFNANPAMKKENTVPGTSSETKKAEEAVAPETTESKPLTNGETKTAETLPSSETKAEPEQQQNSIGDVVPDAVHTGQAQSNPTVTASA